MGGARALTTDLACANVFSLDHYDTLNGVAANSWFAHREVPPIHRDACGLAQAREYWLAIVGRASANAPVEEVVRASGIPERMVGDVIEMIVQP